MRRITATELARNLSTVLDAVEHGQESFEVVRNGRLVARVTPEAPATGASVKQALERFRPDEAWAEDIRRARELLIDRDPWHA